ncbi:hypothetical protein RRG08_059928 [Elysia crispata]|uniref:Uncharacterized protein n=1 Tax=Elysia crispata TaxID=231223 RepID=A0AAE0Y6I4_9GAST|nr:hypothetical protein RRG08_059927 [Elysia crispata]KAK3734750.1 hypothetical protein RRG08_059928 [Elysia crispata]KAK3734751.1 hypothetical protein RRG08_059928 [Elysia crispata]
MGLLFSFSQLFSVSLFHSDDCHRWACSSHSPSYSLCPSFTLMTVTDGPALLILPAILCLFSVSLFHSDDCHRWACSSHSPSYSLCPSFTLMTVTDGPALLILPAILCVPLSL